MSRARLRPRRDGLDRARAAVADLWPDPNQVTTGGPLGGRDLAFAVLPHARRPTRLVPVSPGPVASQILSGAFRGNGARERAGRRLLDAAARAGVLRLVPAQVHVAEEGGESIATHLSALLGQPVRLGIHLGPPRANQKPVLQILTPAGRTVGFAKIGANVLTRQLVAAEAGALEAVAAAGIAGLGVPPVRHHGSWRDLEVLLLGPVESRSTSTVRGAELGDVMARLSLAWGHSSEVLVDSAFWTRLRADAAAGAGPHAPRLRLALDRAAAAYGDRQVAFGAWHGDWTPWNMAVHDHALVVWDWERFQKDVPLGLDAIHFHLQREMRRQDQEPLQVSRGTLARADELLAPWGLEGADARCVFVLYLLAIGSRYAADDQRGAGARLGDLDSWLFRVLDDVLASEQPAVAAPPSADGG